MELEGPVADQENTMYNYEGFGNPSENNAEMEKKRINSKLRLNA